VRAVVAALAALVACAALAAPAHAAADMEIGMDDSRLLLTEPWRAAEVVQEWAALGVETVRLHARWYVIAPDANRIRRPAGFDAADPHDHRYRWGSLDQAVDLVVAAGMTPMVTVTGPAPHWATADPRRRQGQYLPRAAEFRQFAYALARRYGNRVDRYMVWNEPNQPRWLLPQSTCSGRGRRKTCHAVAPHVYRDLLAAAAPAIRAADPGAMVMFGELAPVGGPPTSTWAPLGPIPFLRALGCVDARYRALRTGRCRGFRVPAADAFAYHPHGKQRAPEARNPNPSEAQLGDLDRLFGTLDRLTRRGRLRAPAVTGRRFDVYMTEFGFQTAPPGRAAGVSLAQQARYVQQAAYILWRRPRVRNLTHYQWEDERVMREGGKSGYGGWQSGLHFHDGRPKPVFATFPAPFVHDPKRRTLWGQVRPGGVQLVTVEERAAGSGAWRRVAQAQTDARGYWTSRYRVKRRAAYRFTWVPGPALLGAQPRVATSGVLRIAGSGRSLAASTGA
jgi:hypothetical protein